jgi:hypothetical protein
MINAFQLRLEYSIKKAQEDQVGLQLNDLNQLLPYVEDMNLLGDNMATM